MSDLVEKVIKQCQMGSRQIFQEAFRDHSTANDWEYWHQLWLQSGVIVYSVRKYCEQKLNPPLPLDTPDDFDFDSYAHLSDSFR